MTNGSRFVKILIVDDDEEDFFITSEYIKNIPTQQYQVEWSYLYEDALAKMKGNLFDLIFVDYRLGIKTGMDLLTDSIASGCEAPVILFTSKGTQEIDIKAMENGAYDYLIKSELNTEKLERCIRYSLERSKSIGALKANERKYRSMFDKSKDIVFIASIDLQIIDINYAVTELLQYEQEALLHKPVTVLFSHPKNRDEFTIGLLENGEINDMEIDIVGLDNEVKHCIVSASIELNNNQTKYIQGIIHDNTGRKRAEKATLQSEKLAAAGRLVRTLAHEVRNPLNNINLSVEQLKDAQASADAVIYQDIILRNSKRIGDIITELLASSHTAAQVNLELVNLQWVVDDAIEKANDRMVLKRISLTKHYERTPTMTVVDKEKITLAFLNIIINAIEAMEEASGKLDVSVFTDDDECIVDIRDNGCGISEEYMQRLFEPYFTSKRNGMGLGLASTLNIIQSNNARVDVKSGEGSGTLFEIRFKKSQTAQHVYE